MNSNRNRIIYFPYFLIIAFLLLGSPQNVFAKEPELTHIYQKEYGLSHPWFYGTWKVSYEDKELGEVTGIARVVGSRSGNVTIALRHPKTGKVYYLRSKLVDLSPDYYKPESIRIELVGQSPPSSDEGTNESPAKKDVQDPTHLNVAEGGKLTIRFEEKPVKEGGKPLVAEKTVAVKESEVSEGIWLTVELQIPGGKPSEKLTGTWSYASRKNHIKYNRAGAHYDEYTGTSSGKETWSRTDPIVKSVTTDDKREMYILFQGNDLPVQPGRTVKIEFDDPKVTFTGRYKTDPKDDTRLYARVSLEPGIRRKVKKVTLNGVEGICDVSKFARVVDDKEIMRKRKEADAKQAEFDKAHLAALRRGDKAEARRIREEAHDHIEKTRRWFDATEREKKEEEEEDKLRAELAKEIRKEASKIAQPGLDEVEIDQEYKDAVTGTAKYVFIGAEMQDQMKKETRKSKRELVEAEATMVAIAEKLKDPDHDLTERERRILREMWDNADLKRDAALRYLSDADKIAAAGYFIDGVLTVTGGKLITVAKKGVTKTAERFLAKEAAEKVVTTTTETGISRLTGRGIVKGTEKVAGKGAAETLEAGAAKFAEKARGVATKVGEKTGAAATRVLGEEGVQAVKSVASKTKDALTTNVKDIPGKVAEKAKKIVKKSGDDVAEVATKSPHAKPATLKSKGAKPGAAEEVTAISPRSIGTPVETPHGWSPVRKQEHSNTCGVAVARSTVQRLTGKTISEQDAILQSILTGRGYETGMDITRAKLVDGGTWPKGMVELLEDAGVKTRVPYGRKFAQTGIDPTDGVNIPRRMGDPGKRTVAPDPKIESFEFTLDDASRQLRDGHQVMTVVDYQITKGKGSSPHWVIIEKVDTGKATKAGRAVIDGPYVIIGDPYLGTSLLITRDDFIKHWHPKSTVIALRPKAKPSKVKP